MPPGVAMVRARGIGPSVGEGMSRSAGNPGELACAEEMPLLADLHLQHAAQHVEGLVGRRMQMQVRPGLPGGERELEEADQAARVAGPDLEPRQALRNVTAFRRPEQVAVRTLLLHASSSRPFSLQHRGWTHAAVRGNGTGPGAQPAARAVQRILCSSYCTRSASAHGVVFGEFVHDLRGTPTDAGWSRPGRAIVLAVAANGIWSTRSTRVAGEHSRDHRPVRGQPPDGLPRPPAQQERHDSLNPDRRAAPQLLPL